MHLFSVYIFYQISKRMRLVIRMYTSLFILILNKTYHVHYGLKVSNRYVIKLLHISSHRSIIVLDVMLLFSVHIFYQISKRRRLVITHLPLFWHVIKHIRHIMCSKILSVSVSCLEHKGHQATYIKAKVRQLDQAQANEAIN